jgi:hypothetical protein
MKPKYHDVALAAGGSHYPSVGGKLLDTYSDILVLEAVKLLDAAGHADSAQLLKQYFEVEL